jgi:hypothetical protein
MRNIRNIASVLAVLSLGACAQTWLNYEPALDKFGNLLVSTIEPSSAVQKMPNQGIKALFKFTVKNTGKDSVVIYGEKSEIAFRTSNFPVKCIKTSDKASEITLVPSAAIHVECEIVIQANYTNQLSSRDTTAGLSVPYEASNAQNVMHFKIYFRAEDFK